MGFSKPWSAFCRQAGTTSHEEGKAKITRLEVTGRSQARSEPVRIRCQRLLRLETLTDMRTAMSTRT